MKYKIISLMLGVICIVLAINYYRLQKFTNAVGTTAPCPEMTELEKLRMEKVSWIEREDQFLKENGALVSENNELKMQLNRKPIYIYKNAKSNPLNDGASEHYTGVLSRRYNAK